MKKKNEKRARKNALKKLHRMTDELVKDLDKRFYSSSRSVIRNIIRKRYGNKMLPLIFKDFNARYSVV